MDRIEKSKFKGPIKGEKGDWSIYPNSYDWKFSAYSEEMKDTFTITMVHRTKKEALKEWEKITQEEIDEWAHK